MALSERDTWEGIQIITPKKYKRFKTLPYDMLRENNLSDFSFRLLVYLTTLSPTYKPSEAKLAKAMNKSVSAIQRAVKELKTEGYLRIDQRWLKRDNNHSTTKWQVFIPKKQLVKNDNSQK